MFVIVLVMADDMTATSGIKVVGRTANNVKTKPPNNVTNLNSSKSGSLPTYGLPSAGQSRLVKKSVVSKAQATPIRIPLSSPSKLPTSKNTVTAKSRYSSTRTSAAISKGGSTVVNKAPNNTRTNLNYPSIQKSVQPTKPMKIASKLDAYQRKVSQANTIIKKLPSPIKSKTVAKETASVRKQSENRAKEFCSESDKNKCKCDDNGNCVCKTKDGKPSLKKTKSRRKPARHATYVSELDKSLREKFKRKEPEKKSPEKQHSDQVKEPVRRSSNRQTAVRNSSNTQAPPVRRVVHCPLHSKYGNKAFIKARCIEECPHFNKTQPETNTPSRSKFLQTKKLFLTDSGSSNNSSPGILRKAARPTQGTSRIANTQKYSSQNKHIRTSIPFPLNASTNKIFAKEKLINNRVKSAPATSGRSSKPVQSYLVRNGLIPTKKLAEEKIVAPRKKIRQKSFKLSVSRSRSKSFKNKNFKPTVLKKVRPEPSDEEVAVDSLDLDTDQDSLVDIHDELLYEKHELTDSNKENKKDSNVARVTPRKKIRQKSFKLSRSRSKSMRRKKSTRANNKISAQEKLDNSDSGEENFEDDSLAEQSNELFPNDEDTLTNDLTAELEHLFDGDEDEEELAEYYFNLFKEEFPEIVSETGLTKEELVSSNKSYVHFFVWLFVACSVVCLFVCFIYLFILPGNYNFTETIRCVPFTRIYWR